MHRGRLNDSQKSQDFAEMHHRRRKEMQLILMAVYFQQLLGENVRVIMLHGIIKNLK